MKVLDFFKLPRIYGGRVFSYTVRDVIFNFFNQFLYRNRMFKCFNFIAFFVAKN